MAKITFHEGLNVIGGTFISVETEKAVCMFDFGFTVTENFDKAVNMRFKDESIPADMVRIGKLPKADYIYDEKTAETVGVKPYSSTDRINFFVISHMHIDHMGGLDMLDPNIPVYMSEDSLRLYRRLCVQGAITYREHENCIGIPYGNSFKLGDIKVTVLPIDHDCTGASGFIMETPDGKILYTGDYRFHGFRPDLTENFGEICGKGNIDLMITESTNASWEDFDMLTIPDVPDQRTEYTLLAQAEELINAEKGLSIVNLYDRNVERIHALGKLSEKCGKKLVLDCAAADYLKEFYPKDAVYVYKETISGRPVRDCITPVSRSEILENPSGYVLQIQYPDAYELLDLSEVAGTFLHMDGYPPADYDPSYRKELALLEKTNIAYHRLSLGGHASPCRLRQMIDAVSPKALVPLHGLHPERVNSKNIGLKLLPERGQTYILQDKEIYLI